jgi:hypothetical protein
MKIKILMEAVQTKSGRKPVFSAELTTQDVRRLAFHLPTRNDPKNNSVQLEGTAGKDGFCGFHDRHKTTLSL